MPRSAPTDASRRRVALRHALCALFLGACSPRHVPEVEAAPRRELVAPAPPARPASTRPSAPAHVREVIRAVGGADLRDVRAATARQGPLYLVEVELALANQGTRWTEADLALRLPPDARIARLALEVGGVLREAAVLPRADATMIYESIVRRLRDPALLERSADDSLRLRVAPIPAQSETGVVFSYVGLERERPIAAHSDERWIARTRLPAPKPAPVPKRLRVLLDTSASMHPRFALHLQRARELLAALAREFAQPVMLELVAFDQTLEVVHDGPLAAIPEFVWTGLRGREAFGATRGADALKAPTQADRIIVITDGEFTESAASLLASGTAMTRAGVDRLDVVTLADRIAAPTPSLQLLRDHVRLALPQRGLVEWRADALERLARRLAGEVRDVRVDVPGATWWSPRTLELGVDDELLLLARSPATPAPVLRGLPDGDVPLALTAEDAEGPLFERMWQALLVDAELAGAAADPTALAALARRTAELGVLTPLTAFLALESEDQEKEYGVRRVDAPILTIDGGEVVVRPPTGAPLRGARLASVPPGEPATGGEFNRITDALERRALELRRREYFAEAVPMANIIRLLFEGGELGGVDGLRAELDALVHGLAADLKGDPDIDEKVAFLRPFAQRVVDSRGSRCRFEELASALQTFAVATQPHGVGAEPPLTPDARLPRELTPRNVVQFAVARARVRRTREAARVLGSLADLEGPLAAAVALDTLPEGHALATALLRELIDGGDRASQRSPRQLLLRRLLAASLAHTGGFAEAFALLAEPLPVIPLRDDEWTSERVSRWAAQTSVAADLRLLGARWTANDPRRKAAIARDVKRLAGARSTDALVIHAYYFGERPLELHAFDGWGSASVVRPLRGDPDSGDDLRTAALQLSAAELPSALEIGGGQRGDWVRIDMFDTTGPKVQTISLLVVLSGPRTKLDLPAHLIGHRVCPPVKPP